MMLTNDDLRALPAIRRCPKLTPHAVLSALAALNVRGAVAELGEGYGTPCVLLGGESRTVPHSASAEQTAREVRDLLAEIDKQHVLPMSVFLSYEAGVACMGALAGAAYQIADGPAARLVWHAAGFIFCPDQTWVFGDAPQLDELIAAGLSTDEPATVDVLAPKAPRLPSLHAPPREAKVAHRARVDRLRESIGEGDVYQANLAHTLDVDSTPYGDGLSAFASAVANNPPPFSCVVDLTARTLLSFSPECFLRFAPTTVSAWPIKGTRPRGATAEADRACAQDLSSSVKDAAEHDMIVDLLRDDLSRVAHAGEVTLVSHRRLLSVRNVHHLESVVQAARNDRSVARWVAAAIPGGSISGAPKSTAVQFIANLEDRPRGAYTGHFGVFHGGCGALNILIRTWERSDGGTGAFKVGGGIVWASDADDEWQETLDKSRAMR